MDILSFMTSPPFEIGRTIECKEEIRTLIDQGITPRIEVDDMGRGISPDTPLVDVEDVRKLAAELLAEFPELINPASGIYGLNQWLIHCWLVDKQQWDYKLTDEGYDISAPGATDKMTDDVLDQLIVETVKETLGVRIPTSKEISENR